MDVYDKDSLKTSELRRFQILSFDTLFKQNLQIPNYQRPYKWTTKNIADLLSDIENAIAKKKIHSCFKYRIGTIILHKQDDNYNIVDGQQRCISLLLLYYHVYQGSFNSKLFEKNWDNPLTITNIYQNYKYIGNWFMLKDEHEKQAIKNALSEVLECVVLVVEKDCEAFQLFDSQNTRGKELYPHDLLKAYHLREMTNASDMLEVVKKWEAINPSVIKELFEKYLFPVLKWTRKEKSILFSSKEISFYKGISEEFSYPYAQRVRKAMPVFQVAEPIIAGKNFFEMVDYYNNLLGFVKKETEKVLDGINPNINMLINQRTSIGLGYAKNLFECAVLLYYDKFKDLAPRAIKNLFTWAFMLRVDLDVLSFASINKYAIGEKAQYSNNFPMFAFIKDAISHEEVANLNIVVRKKYYKAKAEKTWADLYDILQEISGYVR